jgi:hypothetical protein
MFGDLGEVMWPMTHQQATHLVQTQSLQHMKPCVDSMFQMNDYYVNCQHSIMTFVQNNGGDGTFAGFLAGEQKLHAAMMGAAIGGGSAPKMDCFYGCLSKEDINVSKNTRALKCTGCRSVWYCGIACQTKHWKAEHKAKCFKAHDTKKSAPAYVFRYVDIPTTKNKVDISKVMEQEQERQEGQEQEGQTIEIELTDIIFVSNKDIDNDHDWSTLE